MPCLKTCLACRPIQGTRQWRGSSAKGYDTHPSPTRPPDHCLIQDMALMILSACACHRQPVSPPIWLPTLVRVCVSSPASFLESGIWDLLEPVGPGLHMIQFTCAWWSDPTQPLCLHTTQDYIKAFRIDCSHLRPPHRPPHTGESVGRQIWQQIKRAWNRRLGMQPRPNPNIQETSHQILNCQETHDLLDAWTIVCEAGHITLWESGFIIA